MYILGIDTSSSMLTVALSDGNKIISENHTGRQMGLLEYLAPTVESILYENSLEITDLGAVAISLGPGSFTGLRIGMAYAKTLAYTLNIPIVGVPTLKALAKSVSCGFADVICSLVYARVNEVYCAAFSGDLKEKFIDYTFMTVEELLDNPVFRDKKTVFIGNGAIKHKDLICEKVKCAVVSDVNGNYVKGSALNSLAFETLENGKSDDPKTLVPMYIKKPTPVIRKEKGMLKV